MNLCIAISSADTRDIDFPLLGRTSACWRFRLDRAFDAVDTRRPLRNRLLHEPIQMRPKGHDASHVHFIRTTIDGPFQGVTPGISFSGMLFECRESTNLHDSLEVRRLVDVVDHGPEHRRTAASGHRHRKSVVGTPQMPSAHALASESAIRRGLESVSPTNRAALDAAVMPLDAGTFPIGPRCRHMHQPTLTQIRNSPCTSSSQARAGRQCARKGAPMGERLRGSRGASCIGVRRRRRDFRCSGENHPSRSGPVLCADCAVVTQVSR